MRSSSATTSVRAWTALVDADSLMKSTRMAPAGAGQSDQARHDPPAQNVVPQLRPVRLQPDLEVAGARDELEQARPRGAPGRPAPWGSRPGCR